MDDRIRVGISAWADRGLIASGWYPKQARGAEARLRHYASVFRVVENDAPYWALPSERQTAAWAERTPDGFVMNVKAHALLTQHYTDARRLPADLREMLPRDVRDKARLYPKDLDPALLAEVAVRFRAALQPLRARGRLGLVLFQFPVWVPYGRQTRKLVASLRGLLPDDRVAVELRNASWMREDTRPRTLALLSEHDLIYTCVDEPQGFVSSVPPVVAATSDLALVRMHGRNAARWNRAARSASERFEYLYTGDELAEWVPRVRQLADRAGEVHVVFNNCYSDYAARNAEQMVGMLEAAERRAA